MRQYFHEAISLRDIEYSEFPFFPVMRDVRRIQDAADAASECVRAVYFIKLP